jgi:hypothetical protein
MKRREAVASARDEALLPDPIAPIAGRLRRCLWVSSGRVLPSIFQGKRPSANRAGNTTSKLRDRASIDATWSRNRSGAGPVPGEGSATATREHLDNFIQDDGPSLLHCLQFAEYGKNRLRPSESGASQIRQRLQPSRPRFPWWEGVRALDERKSELP